MARCPACTMPVPPSEDGLACSNACEDEMERRALEAERRAKQTLPIVVTDGGRKAAGFKGRQPGDCVTRAIAIATGTPYRKVYDMVNEEAKRERPGRRSDGRKRGRSSARNGVHKATVRRLMTALGWTWTPTMSIGSGCKVHLRRGEIPMTGRLVVSVSKHLVAVVDGVIHDVSDPSRDGDRCVYGYWRQA